MTAPPKSLLLALKCQFFENMPYPTDDYTGKTIIVTGANAGIGLEIARHFARLNAEKVILACRSRERGEAARKNIEASTREGSCEVWDLDLSSFESVKAFSEKAKSLPRVDILINNAGYLDFKHTAASNGVEMITMVNYVATFYLTITMLPILRKSAAKFNFTPRIVLVSSDAAFMTKFSERDQPNILESLNRDTDIPERYGVSKIMGLMSMRRLVEAIEASNEPKVVINAAHPGFCQSDMFRRLKAPFYHIYRFIESILARSAEHGARSVLHAASVEDAQGRYYLHCRVWGWPTLTEGVEGEKLTDKVWGELKEFLEKYEPGLFSKI